MLGVAAAAAIAQGATHLIHVFVLDGRYADLLDADSNRSVFDIVSVVAEGSACAACLALAGLYRSARPRFLALAGLLAFITVDDAIGLHDRIGVDWPLVLFPLLACTFVLLWSALDERRASAYIRVGLLLLTMSVLLGQAAEPVLTAFGWGVGSWPYEIKIVIKQGAELAGWIVIAGALVMAAAAPSMRRAASHAAGRRTATSGSL
jgi:hypothetical protein